MARTPKDADTGSTLTDENVADYLRRHRDFLVRHPQLLQVLTPPDRFGEQPAEGGAEIVDLQGAMVNRLQQDLARAKLNQDALIQSARSNMSSQTQIHDAVLALVEGRDLDHFIHMATQELPLILQVDVVSICIEGPDNSDLKSSGLFLLADGDVDQLLGEGRNVLLRETASGTERLFGPAAALVTSDALVRLHGTDDMPPALLAIGARESGRFHPGQGTELLGFLAAATARCLQRFIGPDPT